MLHNDLAVHRTFRGAQFQQIKSIVQAGNVQLIIAGSCIDEAQWNLLQHLFAGKVMHEQLELVAVAGTDAQVGFPVRRIWENVKSRNVLVLMYATREAEIIAGVSERGHVEALLRERIGAGIEIHF